MVGPDACTELTCNAYEQQKPLVVSLNAASPAAAGAEAPAATAPSAAPAVVAALGPPPATPSASVGVAAAGTPEVLTAEEAAADGDDTVVNDDSRDACSEDPALPACSTSGAVEDFSPQATLAVAVCSAAALIATA